MKRLQCLANSHSLPVVHISVIVAALNEAANISQVLQSVINEAKDPCAINEVVLVDAGSRDNTVDLAKKMASKSKVPIRIISSPERGRAFQFNWGVRYAASSNVFLFLHGDTILPKHYDETVRDTLLKPNTVAGAFSLGFRNSERKLALTFIAFFANVRSKLFQLPFGDQGLFLFSTKFHKLGGFPRQLFMEDVEIISRLKRLHQGRIRIAPVKVWTDARRWNSVGIWKTTLLNQFLLFCYYFRLVRLDKLALWYHQLYTVDDRLRNEMVSNKLF
ncbi:glycosyl transferase, group 2 family protein [Galdieria sulphuraria]|uniref:Glycosyl transferase, group 2 family protein n=1 Tax=Galdieria sulphuraria TaxID=130081 RepID=M2W7M3_GALSU|nr:glycosyl transferase, group 2 family protein [Galdieria sulphuraria]EME31821.1 glycosyl transferase, group 2 family protein [Galdieria sulphuraria]|eukprot:XP_005708341.1 glycosyl transferase, group 2 family protein [Galdieria sulphuraria]